MSTHLTDCLYRVSFRRYRPLKLPLSCEVGPKRWFLGPRFVGEGMHFQFFRPYGRIWFSSVQQAQRIEGEKRKKKKKKKKELENVAIIAMYCHKAARRDSICSLTSCGASNLSCRQIQCRFIYSRCGRHVSAD